VLTVLLSSTLAGLQRGTRCYCGSAADNGPGGCGGKDCLPGVGTRTADSECVWPCTGDPSVACGGGSYMWGVNSVYNVSASSAAVAAAAAAAEPLAAPPPPPPPETEGSGNAGLAVVINGVRVFSRGANLVPFELLEATVSASYIRRTVQVMLVLAC